MDWEKNQGNKTLASNNIKYLEVTIDKQGKDLYDKNFKSLKKEIEEDIRSWKDPHAYGLVGLT